MLIDFTNAYVEGEPGSNLYFGGSNEDYFKLSEAIEVLIRKKDAVVEIHNLDFCKTVDPNLKIFFKSVDGGNILSKIDGKNLITELDISLWENIFIKCVLLSRHTGHFYIEFDDLNLVEEYNIIWSSEWVNVQKP